MEATINIRAGMCIHLLDLEKAGWGIALLSSCRTLLHNFFFIVLVGVFTAIRKSFGVFCTELSICLSARTRSSVANASSLHLQETIVSMVFNLFLNGEERTVTTTLGHGRASANWSQSIRTSEEPICLVKEPRSPGVSSLRPPREKSRKTCITAAFILLPLEKRGVWCPSSVVFPAPHAPFFKTFPFLHVVVTELTCLWSRVGFTSCSPRMLFLFVPNDVHVLALITGYAWLRLLQGKCYHVYITYKGVSMLGVKNLFKR